MLQLRNWWPYRKLIGSLALKFAAMVLNDEKSFRNNCFRNDDESKCRNAVLPFLSDRDT